MSSVKEQGAVFSRSVFTVDPVETRVHFGKIRVDGLGEFLSMINVVYIMFVLWLEFSVLTPEFAPTSGAEAWVNTDNPSFLPMLL